ncbi:MAG: acyl-CoA synthetase [Acidimicrobiales bacterium]|jgi:O-succinylbenzoate-CoA ligase
MNIGQFLTKRAYREPATEAIFDVASNRRFSFDELNVRSNKTANALNGIGVAPGDRVGLLLMNGVEFVETFFAVAKIGAVNVPLNMRLVADELEFILKDSGTSVLVFSEEFAAVCAELASRGDKTDITTWIQVGGTPASGVVEYNEWVGAAADTEIESTASGDDYVFIMYTSGTTGLPKGVIHSHDTVMWSILTGTASLDFRIEDRFLNSLPLFHVGALNPVLSNVYAGGTTVLMRSFDPAESWRLITEEKINSTLMVPAMLQFMQMTYNAEAHDLSTLRWVLSGAAPVPVTLIEAYASLGVEIHQVYGLTETAGPGCVIIGDEAKTRVGSTGRAFFHGQVRVVREDGTDCNPGESGEVLLAGPNIMVGYWNRPEATAESIVDGWLHTGDAGVLDEDGFLTIVDRIKDMLISGGENVYPAEIENVLLSHDSIADAGVIGVPSKKWGESPLAVIVKSSDVSAEDVMAFCNGKLAPYKAIKVVEFVDVIPRNPSGKILKRVLRDQYAEIEVD